MESAFGPVFAIAGAGLVFLIVAAFLWDAVSAGVDWVRARIGGGVPAQVEEPAPVRAPSDARRTAQSRQRREARIAARRDAIHTKRAEVEVSRAGQ
ncbi:hypothetical protein ACFWU5_05315 [Nocardia sp. NPDC058640]|uniref:hypothetical protein n=1 Tax=Nocardia sp. NPDC058640 TaxID=3346571 RepID=UPI00365202D3